MTQLSIHKNIAQNIIVLRKTEVILDRDLANLYQVENRALKQAVKRNIERFPSDFMFELSEKEVNWLVSQTVIPSKSYFGGALPFAFTEQGVAMLSAILKSQEAIHVSIKIMKAFVLVRRLISSQYELSKQIAEIEQRHTELEIKTNERFEQVFNAISTKKLKPEHGIFYDGQIFDAWEFVSGITRDAQNSIILIDNYIDESVLMLLSKRKPGVEAAIFTRKVTLQLETDLKKHNQQYPPITLQQFTKAHDRFLIIDQETVYHIGASLKDLGKRWFAFSRINLNAKEMIGKLKGD